MIYVQDKAGTHAKPFSDYPVATGTVIKAGTPVTISNGLVVAAATSGANALLGVAAETHLGAAYAMELPDRRTNIAVYDSPLGVFKATGIVFENTTDSAAGVVTIGASAVITADQYNGCKAVCINTTSGSGFQVGKEYAVADGTSTTLVLDTSLAAKVGDKFKLYPKIGESQIGFAVADGALTGELALSKDGASYVCAGSDAASDTVLVVAKKHIFGCGV